MSYSFKNSINKDVQLPTIKMGKRISDNVKLESESVSLNGDVLQYIGAAKDGNYIDLSMGLIVTDTDEDNSTFFCISATVMIVNDLNGKISDDFILDVAKRYIKEFSPLEKSIATREGQKQLHNEIVIKEVSPMLRMIYRYASSEGS